MHKIVILALKNVVPLDLVIPLEIFTRAKDLKDKPCYDVRLWGESRNIKESIFNLQIRHSLRSLSEAQTIVIPGTEFPYQGMSPSLRRQLIKAHSKGARIISICSGAFHLAETGLLDGKEATTHWLATEDFKEKFPRVKLNPNVLYVDSGQVMTSAGACAGIDLCLHVIRKDFGSAVAARSAKLAVMPLQRSGGQAQFIDHPQTKDSGALTDVLGWIEKNLHQDLDLEQIARKACMSVRTLNRHFKNQVGTSPQKWILRARIQRAKELLETTRKSMEEISASVGFGSPVTMREHFRNQVRTNPKSYRESFQKRAPI